MAEIHPTAFVHPDAIIGEGTRIGAHCVIDAKVSIGKNCTIHENVIIRDYCSLGDEVKVHPFAVIGGEPQHFRYKGEPTTAVIGNRVTLREYVTINRGTVFGNQTTVVGEGSYLMAYCHVAHDCVLGEKVILANCVHLAGHVQLGKCVTIGGVSGITQFVSIGDYAFLGGSTLLRKDMPPYLIGKGNDFHAQGVNVVGLERNGFSEEAIRTVRKLYKIFYMQKLTVSQAIEKVSTELASSPEVETFLKFLQNSKLGLVR